MLHQLEKHYFPKQLKEHLRFSAIRAMDTSEAIVCEQRNILESVVTIDLCYICQKMGIQVNDLRANVDER
jgi:hypothetical protein